MAEQKRNPFPRSGRSPRERGRRVESFEELTRPVPVERHPATQQHDPNRYVGIVLRVNVEKAFSFLRDGENREYFAHKSVYSPPELFDEASRAEGRMVVSFYRSETTKGWRAAGVRAATVEEAGTIEHAGDNRGNR